MTSRYVWILLAAIVTAVGTLRAASVSATLDPPQIALGDSAQLTVTVSGTQGEAGVPKVDGLEIISVGESTQVEIINGSMTSTASRTYAVTPQRAGNFTIPAIQVGDAKSQPVTLRVSQGGAPSPAFAPAPTPGPAGPVVLPAPGTSAIAPAAPAPGAKYGWLEVTLPKKEFYEGEMAPVDIKAYLAEDANPSNLELPQFTSDGFTLNSLGTKPDRQEMLVQGRAYVVLTWHTALTAVKAGNYTLDLKMPISIAEAQQMPDINDDASFNSFFRNAFAAIGGTKKDVILTGRMEPLKILPLPQAGRPAGFSGAVGQFEAEASVSARKANVGDPLTLRLKISGRGNFDRVSTEGLASEGSWRTYSPKSHFDAADALGLAGTKTFEQPIIPNDGAVREVPSLSFSYFDPDAHQFVTRTTAPIPVSITGAAAAINAAPTSGTPPPVPAAAPQPPPLNVAADDLRMNRIEAGSFVSTLRPLYLNPAFLAAQAVPLIALLAGLAWIRRQRSSSSDDRAKRTAFEETVRREVGAMDAAARDHQVAAFFVHARNALQQRLGPPWNMRPEAVTVADVDSHLGSGGTNIRSIFEMADQASYSDLHFGDADLQQWRQVVIEELAEARR